MRSPNKPGGYGQEMPASPQPAATSSPPSPPSNPSMDPRKLVEALLRIQGPIVKNGRRVTPEEAVDNLHQAFGKPNDTGGAPVKYSDDNLMALLHGFDGVDSTSHPRAISNRIEELQKVEPETQRGRGMLDGEIARLRRLLLRATPHGGFRLP